MENITITAIIVFYCMCVLCIRDFFQYTKIRSVKTTYGITNGIPNIIFRTHRSFIVHNYMYEECFKKWVTFNPNHTILWFDNKNCDKFMKTMGPSIYGAYRKIKPGAFKADLWRACVLYRYGGVYVDSFTVPYCSVKQMLKGCRNSKFLSIRDLDSAGGGIHNGILISTPKHPFIVQYIKMMLKNINNNYYGESIFDITGPICLNKAINKVINKPLKTKHKIGYNKFGKNSFYLYELRVNDYHLILPVYKNDKMIMRKKHSLLWLMYEKLWKRNKTYKNMWINKRVYI